MKIRTFISHAAFSVVILFRLSTASTHYVKQYVEDSCVRNNRVIYNATQDGIAGILKTTAYPPYASDLDCTIYIKPPPGLGIVLSIRKIDFRPKEIFSCTDYIQVYHSDPFSSPTTLCRFKFDLKEELSYFSEGAMKIFFHTGPKFERYFEEGFTLTYTAVSTDVNDCKSDDKFFCDNGRCIPKDYTCDGRNNCGDRSDESHQLCDTVGYYDFRMMDGIYIVVLVLAFVITMSSCFAVCFFRRRRLAHHHGHEDTPAYSSSTPYEAVHPSGFFICSDPAGPRSPYPHHNSNVIHSEGGFSNPCYPTGIPQHPPPYKH